MKIGLSAAEIYLGEYILDKFEPVEYILNNNGYLGIFIITNYRVPKNDLFKL